MDLIRRLGNDSAPAKRGCFTVGVCPVESGPHAAEMTAELALMAARQTESRILMIETSPLHKVAERSFSLDRGAPGLGEMLAPPPNNRFDTIHPTNVPNLFVMPAGSLARIPSKEQLEWVHSILACHFQGIVLELPAMGELRAREFCGKIPNAVVLVSHSGCGSWSIRRAVKRLQAAQANIVGSTIVR